MLYTVNFVVRVFVLFFLPRNFPCHHARYWRQQKLSSEDGSDRDMETRGAASELSHGSSRSMTVVSRFSLYVDHRRVIYFTHNTGFNITLVYEAIKLEGPRAYVINCHSEQVDFVGCGENV